MNRFIALLLGCLFIVCTVFTGCSVNSPSLQSIGVVTPVVTPAATPVISPITTPGCSKAVGDMKINNNEMNDNEAEVTNKPEGVITVWSYNDDVTKMLAKFSELHPDFKYKFNISELPLVDDFQGALNQALATGGQEAADIYTVAGEYAINYTQGEASSYAADYKALGIDVDTLLREASIPQYMIDLGTNPEGKLVSLGYESSVGVYAYRRTIAKDTWGTDEPSEIEDIIGPGWEKYLEAAKDLKAKGYGISSGTDDLWYSVANSAAQGWVVDGKLVIDPKREEFMELSMKLKKNKYSNNTRMWSDEWYNDMKDAGKMKIFGFFCPSWFLSYVLALNCGGDSIGKGTYGDWAVCEPPVGFQLGGSYVLANKNSKDKAAIGEVIKWITLDTSETGLQYLWANDKLGNGKKDAVTSATVMKASEGALDILGGQNLFDAYITSGSLVNGNNITKYDNTIDYYWLEQVHAFIAGKKSKKQAIADFKKQIAKELDIIVQ